MKEDDTHSNSPTGFFKGYDSDMSSGNNENYKGEYSDGDSSEEIATKTGQVQVSKGDTEGLKKTRPIEHKNSEGLRASPNLSINQERQSQQKASIATGFMQNESSPQSNSAHQPPTGATQPILSEGSKFHLFNCIAAGTAENANPSEVEAQPSERATGVGTRYANKYLEESHRFLWNLEIVDDQRLYQQSRETTYLEIEKNLTLRTPLLKKMRGICLENEIFQNSQDIFQFFFPLDTDGPCAFRFWGNVGQVLNVSM